MTDDSWSDCLGSMTLTRAFTSNNQPMTILIRKLLDHTALSGVMKELYGECLSVYAVGLLEDK